MTVYWWLTDNLTVGHVADHNGDELPNSPWTNPDGWSWNGDYPDQIYNVMLDHAVEQAKSGNTAYFVDVLSDLLQDDIERGQP